MTVDIANADDQFDDLGATDNPFAENGPDHCFRVYLERGEFYIQRCESCEQHVFYPRICCPHCGSPQLNWIKPCGRGVVYSTSVPRSKEGAWNIALVDLAEGPRMMSRVVGIPAEAVTIGMPVEAFVGTLDADPTPVVLFRPVGEVERGLGHGP